MEIKNTSYYVNPNSKTLTTNLANTKIFDEEAFECIQKTLRPVEDLAQILMKPIKLAGKTMVDAKNNAISIAEGTSITVDAGYVLTVKKSGVEVSGGDLNNQTARQKAQDMAGALSTLLRNASGMMQNIAYSSEAYEQWTEDIENALRYFGIDTSKDFSVNGMKYTKNEKGNWVSQTNVEALEAYEQLKGQNQTYRFADEKTKSQVRYMSNYFLRTVPSAVKDAWQETLDETGINPFPDGYTSVLQQLVSEKDYLTGGNDNIFGETIESSIEGIEAILNRIQNPIGIPGSDTAELIKGEKEFYTTLLSKVSSIEFINESI